MRWSDREVADGVVVALLCVGEGQAGVAGTDPLGTLPAQTGHRRFVTHGDSSADVRRAISAVMIAPEKWSGLSYAHAELTYMRTLAG